MKTTGYILNGVYYKHVPAPISDGDASTYKTYSHDKQRRDHARDMLQPTVNGAPNPEFIAEYPNEAKEHGLV